jgi:hypothetical protein
MAECLMKWHEWDQHHVNQSRYQEFRITCRICGAGHMLALTMKPTGEVQADIIVFAAKDESKVSRDVIRWSLLTCEGTIQEMQQDGMNIIRGKTSIPTPK